MQRSVPTIVLEPGRSRWALGLPISLTMLLSCAAWWLGHDAAASSVMLLCAGTAIARVAWVERAQSKVRVVLQQDGGWHWRSVGANDEVATLTAHTDLGVWLGLNFKTQSGRVRYLALWPDSIDARTWHALRLWLRHGEMRAGAPHRDDLSDRT